MLKELSSEEISEWYAFFKVKAEMEEAEKMGAEAKERAKKDNR